MINILKEDNLQSSETESCENTGLEKGSHCGKEALTSFYSRTCVWICSKEFKEWWWKDAPQKREPGATEPLTFLLPPCQALTHIRPQRS